MARNATVLNSTYINSLNWKYSITCTVYNSIQRIRINKKLPKTRLWGRFFECDPNKNIDASFLSEKNSCNRNKKIVFAPFSLWKQRWILQITNNSKYRWWTDSEPKNFLKYWVINNHRFSAEEPVNKQTYYMTLLLTYTCKIGPSNFHTSPLLSQKYIDRL